MTLLQLEYFVEICRYKNFTKAAEIKHVTQPVMTNAVKSLESEFGVRLIERTNKELYLTKAGEALWEMADRLLNDAEQMKLAMYDMADENHRLLFGCPSMTSAAHFPELFQIVHSKCPDIEIQSTHELSAKLYQMLDKGELNLLLIPYKPNDKKYYYHMWRKTRFLFCVSKEHPLADRTSVSFRDICHEPLISYTGDVYFKIFDLDRKYRESGGKIEIIYRCRQINIMQDLIRQNVGCGFLIEHSFSGESGIVGILLEEELTVTSYLVWTRESVRFSAVRRVLACIGADPDGRVDDR